jgi:S-(hydroxymethyl)glutathione dehydrogenase / alcohol dehydrogenase
MSQGLIIQLFSFVSFTVLTLFMIKNINACCLVAKEKVSIRQLDLKDLTKGQVLIKLNYSSICQTQINEYKQKKDTSKFYPHILGHEGSGVVLEVGAGVKKVKKNDKVVITWLNCKGLDSGPQKFSDSDKNATNSSSFFTFADHAVVSENKVLKLNKKTNMKIAPLLGCAIPTALGSVDQFNIKKNDNVAIVGAGGIGLTILIYLIFLNVKKITIFDIDQNKINFIKKNFPKVEVINTSSNKLDINKLINKFDFALESAGSVKAMEFAFDLIKNNGTTLVIGNDHYSSKISINPFDLIKGKKIYGSWGGFIKIYDDKFKFYEKVLNKKSSMFKKIVNYELDFKNIDKAFKNFGKKNIIRPIIKF